MTRIEIQRALYDARNEYLKAKASTEFYASEISFLKMCEDALDLDLSKEMFKTA